MDFDKYSATRCLSSSGSRTAKDVEGLMHINLIIAIEREFQIRFSNREITAHLQKVADLMDLIACQPGASS